MQTRKGRQVHERTSNSQAGVKPWGAGAKADVCIANQHTESLMFDAELMAVICERENLQAALRRVVKNKGSPGVDGMTVDELPAYLKGHWPAIKEQLLNGAYQPRPIKRTEVPKPGSRDQRKLGIPCVIDRFIQQAILQGLQGQWDQTFSEHSYGFRPGRSAHGALKEVRECLKLGLTAVYDADLKGYFDSIPHDKLMKCLRMRVVDRSVLKLIRMWLEAPVEEDDGHGGKRVCRSNKGTPQGGVISPLLANVYLHWFEKVFYAAGGPGTWAKARVVRYADDFMVLARYQGGQIRGFIETKIEAWLGLELNRDKTKVVDLREAGSSVDFLGYTFRYDRDLYGRGHRYLNVLPSKKALKASREAVRQTINRRHSFVPVTDLIEGINRQLRGWANYFSFGYPRNAKRAMNWYVRSRLRGHLRRRSQRPFRPPEGRSYYEHFKRLGLIYL